MGARRTRALIPQIRISLTETRSEWSLANDVRPRSSDASACHIPHPICKPRSVFGPIRGCVTRADAPFSPPSAGCRRRESFFENQCGWVRTGGEEGSLFRRSGQIKQGERLADKRRLHNYFGPCRHLPVFAAYDQFLPWLSGLRLSNASLTYSLGGSDVPSQHDNPR
jgi:hypothetical protein